MRENRRGVHKFVDMNKDGYSFKSNTFGDKDSAQREVDQIEKLNFIGEMAAGMGHEIRNPLTTVRGFLQMFAQRERNTKNLEYYTLMIEELDRVNVIIGEYLSLAKDKAIMPENRSLNAIVESIYPILENVTLDNGKHIALELDDIPEVYVDEEEIQKLITNLINNGLEAMSKGGLIVIRTFQDGDNVIMEIKDEGSGMDEEVLGKIGTPFFTTKENSTGLGLAVCYSIANRHNARIIVDTNPEGTSFKIVFKSNPLRN